MKAIQCKECNKLFVVAERDWKTGEASEAEKKGLCGECMNK